MQYSKIEWTDDTWNLWRGCTEVSPACDHCYAREIAKRNPAVLGQWGAGAPRVLGNDLYRRTPLQWNAQAEKAGVRRRVFALSMGDWLDDEVPAAWLAELLGMVYATPWLDWQLLTKRPGNFLSRARAVLADVDDGPAVRWLKDWMEGTPPHNVWVGTTVEDQARAEERVPKLLAIPARVRFLSCEPLVGLVDLAMWLHLIRKQVGGGGPYVRREELPAPGIHWVIAGGESGHGARPMHPEWVRGLRDQCQAAGVPFFFKQWGEWGPGHNEALPSKVMGPGCIMTKFGKKTAGRRIDGREWSEFPVTA